jgi:hypothetical protein
MSSTYVTASYRCSLGESYNSGGKKHDGHHHCVKARKRLGAVMRKEARRIFLARQSEEDKFQALVDKSTTEYKPRKRRQKR